MSNNVEVYCNTHDVVYQFGSKCFGCEQDTTIAALREEVERLNELNGVAMEGYTKLTKDNMALRARVTELEGDRL